jgi:hypothetical protein
VTPNLTPQEIWVCELREMWGMYSQTAMHPDEITHKERRGAPEPIRFPQPQPEPQPEPVGTPR